MTTTARRIDMDIDQAATPPRAYRHPPTDAFPEGRVLAVARSIDGRYMALYRLGGKTATHRFTSAACPARATREEAQHDLDALARAYGWEAVAVPAWAEWDGGAAAPTAAPTPTDAPDPAPDIPREIMPGSPPADAPDIPRGIPGAQTVPLADIVEANPWNPRHHFDEEALNALAASIAAVGVVEPLVVRQRGTWPETYQVIAGERRWRAARIAGITEVPVAIRACSDAEAREIALVENLARHDLNAMEEARAYRALMEGGRTQQEIAERVGRTQPAVSNTVRLLDLPETAQALIDDGTLTATHGRALLRYQGHGPAFVAALAQQAVTQAMAARDLEAGDRIPYRALQEMAKARVIRERSYRYCQAEVNTCGRYLQGHCTDVDCWERHQAEGKAREAAVQSAPRQAVAEEQEALRRSAERVAAARAEEKAIRKAYLDDIEEALAPHDPSLWTTEQYQRSLVFAVLHGVERAGPEDRKTVAAHLGLPAPPAVDTLGYYEQWRPLADYLMALVTADVQVGPVEYAAALYAYDDLQQYGTIRDERNAKADWLLGRVEAGQ